ncbi:hypothetical protein GVAV_001376 [Gurleya vavrai]
MHIVNSLTAGLLYSTFNIIYLFTTLSFILGLLISDSAVSLLSKFLYSFMVYIHCITNLLIAIYGYFLTGNYGDILFRRYFDIKQFYFKIELMVGLLISKFVIGITYIVFLQFYIINNKEVASALMCRYFILSLTALSVILLVCLYFIHPDLFRLKRNNEIREFVMEIAEENEQAAL